MVIQKLQLLKINNLGGAGVAQMDEAQFAEYCGLLDEFTETLPAQTRQLKASFDAKDTAAFSADLLHISDMLVKIKAEEAAKDVLKLLSEFRAKNYESAEAYLNNFTTTVSELSIDIQVARYASEKKEEAAQEEAAPIGQGEKNILAVDDASFLLNMLKLSLQGTPYKFTGVTSGAAALKFLINHTPDLFILDIEMPEMNGYELAKRIRALGQRAPIIFLTGHSSQEHVLKAIQAGGVDFIVKPIVKELVIEKIAKHVGQ